jgi:hypothetical protein
MVRGGGIGGSGDLIHAQAVSPTAMSAGIQARTGDGRRAAVRTTVDDIGDSSCARGADHRAAATNRKRQS